MRNTAATSQSYGCTFGTYTQRVWTDRRSLSWPELANLLTQHTVGRKEGTCIVPAAFRGDRRHKSEAAQIDVAFLDSDAGATLAEIEASVRVHGWASSISSTHSHLTRRTKVSRSNWQKFFADNPVGAVTAYLVEVKGMLPRIAVGAVIAEETAEFVFFEHQPCPKFRVVIPLLQAWRAADYQMQDAANAAWKERIEALAATLGLQHDQSCTDTSRLFYLPRRPADGPRPEFVVVGGAPCDLFGLPAREHGLLDAGRSSGTSEPRRRLFSDADAVEFTEQATGAVFNLRDWARKYGDRFRMADALRAQRPGVLTGHFADRVKVHIKCPNEDAHTEAGEDTATFAVNAGESDNVGFVIHCRHAHCTGKDRLFFVRRMLEQGWLCIADLTDKKFLRGDGGQQQADGAHQETERVFDPWHILQPPPFLIKVLPAVLRAFVEDRASVIGADPCAIAWVCISACSSAIDGSIRLKMKQHDEWSVPPAVWVALIGAPSCKKTPIIDAAWEPLRRAQTIDLSAWREELARWKSLPKEERTSATEPTPRRRLISNDGTMEALQDILGRQSRGIGVLRDELAGWIGSLEKYSNARAGAADRAFFLQSFNGGPHVVDRIGRGTVSLENLLTTICGGIQPDRLKQFGNLTDDGLWQRFVSIIVGPARLGRDERGGSAVSDYAALIDRLLLLDNRMQVELSQPAQAIRREIEQRLFNLEQSEALGARFASFCGKLHGLWGRLCLVLNFIEPGMVPFIIGPRVAEAARELIFGSVLPNAARVFAAAGGAGADVEATRSVAGYLLTKQKARVLASDLVHNVWACRGIPLEDVQRIVSPLVAGGWLTPEREYNPVAWVVNPAVHVQFAERAKQEAARRAIVRQLIVVSEPESE